MVSGSEPSERHVAQLQQHAMLDALRQTVTARLGAVSEVVAARLAGPLSVVSNVQELVMPFAVKIFHYGFIPFVIYLGMRSDSNTKLIDLITPM